MLSRCLRWRLAWSFLHLGSLELRVAVDPAVHCKAGVLVPQVFIDSHSSYATIQGPQMIQP